MKTFAGKVATRYCLFILLCLQPVSAAPTQDGAGLFRCMSGWQQLNYSFEQQVYDEDGEDFEKYRGVLQAQKPDRLRWEVSRPHEELLLLNEEGMWHYQPDLKQAVLSALPRDNPVYMLLQGATRDLEAHWSVTRHPEEDGRYRLLHKDATAPVQYDQLEVKLDTECRLSMLSWQDGFGQRVEMKLRSRNAVPRARQFVFRPPPGTAVYRE